MLNLCTITQLVIIILLGCNHSHMTIPQSEHNFSMPFDRVSSHIHLQTESFDNANSIGKASKCYTNCGMAYF